MYCRLLTVKMNRSDNESDEGRDGQDTSPKENFLSNDRRTSRVNHFQYVCCTGDYSEIEDILQSRESYNINSVILGFTAFEMYLRANPTCSAAGVRLFLDRSDLEFQDLQGQVSSVPATAVCFSYGDDEISRMVLQDHRTNMVFRKFASVMIFLHVNATSKLHVYVLCSLLS